MAELVIGDGLGGSATVSVAADGFRTLATKAAAAKCMGPNALVLRARVRGWGPAFEERTTSAQFVIDPRLGREDLARSILEQTSALVRAQSRQRSLAAALGITAPLDAERFCDTGRLRVDVAAARMLHERLGSDRAVLAWMRDALGAIARNRMCSAAATQARVHGTILIVPFLLQPMEIATRAGAMPGRPRWHDDQIRVVATDSRILENLEAGGAELLEGTALQGRSLVETGSWPTAPLTAFALALRNKATRSVPSRHPGEPMIRERRFALERRLIGVDEAFG